MEQASCSTRSARQQYPAVARWPLATEGSGKQMIQRFSNDAMVETLGLTKSFGDTVAVDRLELSVEPEQVFGFLVIRK
jgi:hypothetical protein